MSQEAPNMPSSISAETPATRDFDTRSTTSTTTYRSTLETKEDTVFRGFDKLPFTLGSAGLPEGIAEGDLTSGGQIKHSRITNAIRERNSTLLRFMLGYNASIGSLWGKYMNGNLEEHRLTPKFTAEEKEVLDTYAEICPEELDEDALKLIKSINESGKRRAAEIMRNSVKRGR
jgi:hypothetical protein